MRETRKIAFVCPRFADGATVGGAETLLRELAAHAAGAGLEVEFLTTCARNHFTWANELPPGERRVDGMLVRFFPVDAEHRDVAAFLAVQGRISRGKTVSDEEEAIWLRNSVNSRALCDHLRAESEDYDRILMGPYLFGLVHAAAAVAPARTLLVPCLHDEPFAYVRAIGQMFRAVRGCIFNSAPERDLAGRLYGLDVSHAPVVGMGIDSFTADPGAVARHGVEPPFLLYCGRREPLKGTPLLLDYFDAFRRRTDRPLRLALTGSGELPTLAAERSGDVIDLGFVSPEDKHGLMAAALAFCHPSVNESLGIVLIESWMAGRPALVHAASAVLVDQCRRSGGGLWFGNYGEFEESLVRLLDEPALADAMGRAGRRYVLDKYSWPAVEARLLQAIGNRGRCA